MINGAVLKEAGIDYESGLKRFMNDKDLYAAVLEAFVGEDLLERARDAFEKCDRKQLLAVVHEAKGSSGNADLTELYTASSSLVALLRTVGYTDAELADSFNNFERAYIKTNDAVVRAIKD